MRTLLFLFLGGMLIGCASPPPYEEFTLARTALKAARESEASRYAPVLWSQAEREFQLGEKNFRENAFDEARRHFQTSMKVSERAENATRMKKFTTGGGSP